MATIDARVRITVEGLGITIGEHIHIVRKAFEDLGVAVEVRDAHPEKDRDRREVMRVRRKHMRKEGIVLIANHVPWPG